MRRVAMLAIVALLASSSQAALTVNRIGANPQVTTAISDFATVGSEMDGMEVTAVSAAGSQTAFWADTGALSGAAIGTGWALSEDGDTYGGTWTLTSSIGILSLFVDAGKGNTVFDSIADPMLTPGSMAGTQFKSYYDGSGTVTYSGPVRLAGEAFMGDLYRYLQIDFANPFQGTMTFKADTDNLLYADDITPVVPAPGALLLAGLGTTAVAFLRRRSAL